MEKPRVFVYINATKKFHLTNIDQFSSTYLLHYDCTLLFRFNVGCSLLTYVRKGLYFVSVYLELDIVGLKKMKWCVIQFKIITLYYTNKRKCWSSNNKRLVLENNGKYFIHFHYYGRLLAQFFNLNLSTMYPYQGIRFVFVCITYVKNVLISDIK